MPASWSSHVAPISSKKTSGPAGAPRSARAVGRPIVFAIEALRFFKSEATFRACLEKRHDSAGELWVGFYNKQSARGGLTYRQALDQALCFGWIDGVRKRLDEHSYTIRFTPRQPKSHWSRVNTDRVAALRAAGLMAPSGLKSFASRDPVMPPKYSYERAASVFDAAEERAFRTNPRAWAFFESQAPWYQRVARSFVVSAKREETRRRRLALLIDDSAHGRRLGAVSYERKARR
jgi:uncharacterized protein YdeI (YjbR/CyaY-like superfamily)